MFKVHVRYLEVDFASGREQYPVWISGRIERKDSALTKARQIASKGLEIERGGEIEFIPLRRIWSVKVKPAPEEDAL